jgi:formylglycine-generating enzyme required for sulfatase activity
MSWAAIEGFRKWTAKRRRLLQGLIGVAIDGVASCVPGGALAVWSTRIVGEFAKHGVDRLANASDDVPDVKPAGQAFSAEQLDQLNGWLASLSASYANLLDRLDSQVALPAEASDEQLSALVRQALSQHADLAREFDAHAEEVRRQTLSLARIEERLDDIFHGQRGIALSLEEIKAFLLQCAAPPGEWEAFRRARPESVRLLNEADALFLAGRREEGMNVLLRLFNERGVGQATLCRRLGGAWMAEGKLKEAGMCLQEVTGPDGRPPAAVTRTLTSLTSSTTRGSRLPVWRSLPRGFVIEERWRIDSEVGRGGMASVYRAVGIDDINRDQLAAIKVPAPGLLDDAASRQRFVQEILVSQKLSRDHHKAIVETLGYVRLADPHTRRPLYGLVLEYIDGLTLAHWLAQRQARGEQLSLKEIEMILQAVCAALEHAHSQSILHRDLKPQNIMVTRDGRIKLMDFGIARVLEDRRQTLTGGAMGTWSYLPPEFLDPDYQADVRSDVFLAANLLVELLTFHPQGNAEKRSDCPEAWLELISNAMNRVMRKRPASIRKFLEDLRAGLSPKPKVEPITKPEPKQKQEVQPRRIVNSIGMRLALVEPGVFLMGSPANEAERGDDEHQHEVEITQPFYVGAYPVTQEQYYRVMGVNPSWFSPRGGSKHKVKDMDTRQFPVEAVTWMDAVEFCRRLTDLPEEKENERTYRLPTEAEWEYACRGGPPLETPTPPFYFGSSLSSSQANFDGNYPYGGANRGVYLQRPTKAGSYPDNLLGLFDLHGNVLEWCADWYDPTYYNRSPRQDPQGPENGERRILRGGSWKAIGRNCRSAFRHNLPPGNRNDGNGFRVVSVVGART